MNQTLCVSLLKNYLLTIDVDPKTFETLKESNGRLSFAADVYIQALQNNAILTVTIGPVQEVHYTLALDCLINSTKQTLELLNTFHKLTPIFSASIETQGFLLLRHVDLQCIHEKHVPKRLEIIIQELSKTNIVDVLKKLIFFDKQPIKGLH
jgi:hypothetical protein